MSNDVVYYTVNELSNIWGIAKTTITQWIRRGLLDGQKGSKEYIIAKPDALNFAREYGDFYKARKCFAVVLSDWYEQESKIELRIQESIEAEELKPMDCGHIRELLVSMEYNLDACKSFARRLEVYIADQEDLISQVRAFL